MEGNLQAERALGEFSEDLIHRPPALFLTVIEAGLMTST